MPFRSEGGPDQVAACQGDEYAGDFFRPDRDLPGPSRCYERLDETGGGPGQQQEQAMADSVSEEQADALQNFTLDGDDSENDHQRRGGAGGRNCAEKKPE